MRCFTSLFCAEGAVTESNSPNQGKWPGYAWAAPLARVIVPLGMIIVLGSMSMAWSMWQDW